MLCRTSNITERIRVDDYHDCDFEAEIARDVLEGLSSPKKWLPCKYFYDAYGSSLFDKICSLDEYYQTRTEMGILRKYARCIMDTTGVLGRGHLVELGAGGNRKIRTLLDTASELDGTHYVPVDVSRTALTESAEELVELYDDLQVHGIVADFSKHMDVIRTERQMLVLFLGSTIGNLNEQQSAAFLNSIARVLKPGDHCLIGFDMLKDTSIIENAYNDASGVSSSFNKNILSVINTHLEADFDTEHFDHLSYFNEDRMSMETFLRANRDLSAKVSKIGLEFEMKEGEKIHTEISRKFTHASVQTLCEAAGLVITNWYSDEKNWFSLVEMTVLDS
jgi:L-histidine N-alpha-methyltransferase